MVIVWTEFNDRLVGDTSSILLLCVDVDLTTSKGHVKGYVWRMDSKSPIGVWVRKGSRYECIEPGCESIEQAKHIVGTYNAERHTEEVETTKEASVSTNEKKPARALPKKSSKKTAKSSISKKAPKALLRYKKGAESKSSDKIKSVTTELPQMSTTNGG